MTETTTGAGRARASLPLKRRSPALCYLGAIVTLGIYWLVWYYQMNRELAEMGRRVNPGGALLTVMFGGIIIVPPYVSAYNTAQRVHDTEDEAGVRSRVSPGLGLFLYFLLGLNLPYLQSHMNGLIDRHENGVA